MRTYAKVEGLVFFSLHTPGSNHWGTAKRTDEKSRMQTGRLGKGSKQEAKPKRCFNPTTKLFY